MVLTNNRDTIASGAFSPDCAPRSSVHYSLVLPSTIRLQASSLSLLHFDICDAYGTNFLHQSFVLNKLLNEWKGNPMQVVQEASIRTGHKATMAERIKQKGRLPQNISSQ